MESKPLLLDSEIQNNTNETNHISETSFKFNNDDNQVKF